MATKKISKSGSYKITKDSKNTTYEFKNGNVGESVSVNFTVKGAVNTVYARKGNDLYIMTEFGKQSSKKTVLTKVKDYFNYYDTNNDLIKVNTESIYASVITKNYSYVGGDVGGDEILVIGDKYQTMYDSKRLESGNHVIYDLGGNDYYDMKTPNENVSMKIVDYSGKEQYTVMTADFDITDYSGNDFYSASSGAKFKSYDNKGNDIYHIFYTTAAKIRDDYGNDYYDINNIADLAEIDTIFDIGYKTGVYLMEYGGNDKYELDNVNKIYFDEQAGNDKYTLKRVKNATFDEYKGKDTYKVTSSTNINICDSKSKDSYTFTDVTALNIEEKSSSDTYTFTNVSNEGKSTTDYSINDMSGSDKYTINNSTNISVTDDAGNDKYTLKNITTDNLSFIIDRAGHDTYYVKASKTAILDSKGNDSYKVVDSINTQIFDLSKKSDDAYKINKLSGVTSIIDYGGTDTLTITSAKKSNLLYMANFKNDETGVTDGSLIIFDKTNSGAVIIRDYFKTEETSGKTMITKNKSAGCVEKIYADTKSLKTSINNFASKTDLDTLSSDVAGWLSNDSHKYGTVSELLTSGKADDISKFIATFVQK